MRVSVVVPATNQPRTLDDCLAAIDASSLQPDELIVVREADGPGPAAARNTGLEQATGDVVVFVDADVVVHPDAIGRIRDAFAQDDALVAVFGSYDDRVPARPIVSGFRNLLHHVVHHRFPGPASTFWAGLGAVRTDVARSVGGFDAALFRRPSIEDIELGSRLVAHGPVVLDPRIQGTHLKRWTLWTSTRTDVVDRGIPWVALMVHRRRIESGLNLGTRERLSAAAAVGTLLAVLRGKRGLAALGLASQVVANRDLYEVVGRRLGARGLLATPFLHLLHQLAAVASVPLGVVVGLAGRAQDPPEPVADDDRG